MRKINEAKQSQKKLWNGVRLEEEEEHRKSSKFVDAGSNKQNEGEGN